MRLHRKSRSALGRAIAPVILGVSILLPSAMPAHAAYQPIRNDCTWYDADGKEIFCQGGSVRKFGDTYYWYGAEILNSSWPPKSYMCFSSTDLSHWKFENRIMTTHIGADRPDVLYNASTQTYVLIAKSQCVDFATCPTPAGNFTYVKSVQVAGNSGGGDASAFQDSDGKGYYVYTGWVNGGTNNALCITELSADYLSIARQTVQLDIGEREASSIVKRRGVYYWFTSETVGWETSPTSYMTATHLAGPWSALTLLPTSPKTGDSYNTQDDFIFPVNGSSDTTFIYCGDRHTNIMDVSGGGYGHGNYYWAPLQFNGTTPTLAGQPGWYIDVATGGWTAALTPPDPDQYEAENMTLTNYTVENNAFAFGGKRVKVASGTGTASFAYQGNSGLKNMTVFYFDTLGGSATFKLSVNGAAKYSWTADDQWVISISDPATHSHSHTSRDFPGVQINKGDQISIDGTANGKDLAALDMVLIKPAGGATAINPAGTIKSGGSRSVIRRAAVLPIPRAGAPAGARVFSIRGSVISAASVRRMGAGVGVYIEPVRR